MKMKLVFLSVVLSALMVNYSVQADTAVDSLLKCVKEYGLLDFFSDPEEKKPTWMNLTTYTCLMMDIGNIYLKNLRGPDYVKDEVGIHTCVPQNSKGKPLENMGGLDNCKITISDVCGNNFVKQLDEEIDQYDIDTFYNQKKNETPKIDIPTIKRKFENFERS